MADDVGIVEWAFRAVWGLVLLFGGIVWRGAVGQMKELRQDLERTKEDHTKFQVFVANEYAKTSDIRTITARIDKSLDTIQADIKTLLQR